MYKFSHIFTIQLLWIGVISCGEIKNENSTIKSCTKNLIEKKQPKILSNTVAAHQYKTETLTLLYHAISCSCAQWSETRLANANEPNKYVWLEPANEKLIDANTLFNGRNLPIIIRVTGQIVSENGFPKIELTKTNPVEAGKVFRYTSIQIIKNGKSNNIY